MKVFADAVSENGFWVNVKAAAVFYPEEYASISRIVLRRHYVPNLAANTEIGPKDLFRDSSKKRLKLQGL